MHHISYLSIIQHTIDLMDGAMSAQHHLIVYSYDVIITSQSTWSRCYYYPTIFIIIILNHDGKDVWIQSVEEVKKRQSYQET